MTSLTKGSPNDGQPAMFCAIEEFDGVKSKENDGNIVAAVDFPQQYCTVAHLCTVYDITLLQVLTNV